MKRLTSVLPILALALLLAVPIVGQSLNDALSERKAVYTHHAHQLSKRLQQWQADAITARSLAQVLQPTEIDRLLAPCDRTALASQIEPLAAVSHLAHLTYTLSAALPWDGGKDFPGIRDVVVSTLTINADAPDDSDIFTFLDSMMNQPGKMTLAELSIARLSDGSETPLGALNLHMTATFQWYSNAEANQP